jgi:hypothetical protein
VRAQEKPVIFNERVQVKRNTPKMIAPVIHADRKHGAMLANCTLAAFYRVRFSALDIHLQDSGTRVAYQLIQRKCAPSVPSARKVTWPFRAPTATLKVAMRSAS